MYHNFTCFLLWKAYIIPFYAHPLTSQKRGIIKKNFFLRIEAHSPSLTLEEEQEQEQDTQTPTFPALHSKPQAPPRRLTYLRRDLSKPYGNNPSNRRISVWSPRHTPHVTPTPPTTTTTTTPTHQRQSNKAEAIAAHSLTHSFTHLLNPRLTPSYTRGSTSKCPRVHVSTTIHSLAKRPDQFFLVFFLAAVDMSVDVKWQDKRRGTRSADHPFPDRRMRSEGEWGREISCAAVNCHYPFFFSLCCAWLCPAWLGLALRRELRFFF